MAIIRRFGVKIDLSKVQNFNYPMIMQIFESAIIFFLKHYTGFVSRIRSPEVNESHTAKRYQQISD